MTGSPDWFWFFKNSNFDFSQALFYNLAMPNPFEFQAVEQNMAENKLLAQPTPEAAVSAINAEFPELDITSCTSVGKGQESFAFEVNNSLIFKFPRESVENNERESKLLKLLESKIQTNVPRVKYEGKIKRFSGTNKIDGVHLDTDILEEATPEEKTALAKYIANFLFELHTKVTSKDIRAAGIAERSSGGDQSPAQKSEVVEHEIDDLALKTFLLDTLEKHSPLRDMSAGDTPVVVHNDFNFENVLIEPKTKRLAGMLDFGNVAVADRYQDFASLYRRDSAFALTIAEEYGVLTGVHIDPEKMRVMAITREMGKLVIPEKRKKALRRLERFYEESKQVGPDLN